MSRFALLLSSIIFVAACAATSAEPTTKPAQPVTESTGAAPPPVLMQAHSLLGPTEKHKRTVDLMKKAGIGMLRDEIYWHLVEVEKGKLRMPPHVQENIDYTVEQGIEILLILDYANPNYDNDMAPHTDEGREAFGRYCKFIVGETKGRINYFEVWNEPNLDGFWRPRKDAEDYAALVKVAYTAVKEVNPDAFVLGGGLSGVPMDFIETIFEQGVYSYMDALSVHPYSTPTSPENANIWGKMTDARELTGQYGEPLDIWVTEYGFPTSIGIGVSDDYQAAMITQSYVGAFAREWVPVFGWYWFGPDGPDPKWHEDRFGLIRQDWSEKPSYKAMQKVTGWLKDAKYVEEVCEDELITAHTFESDDDSYITVLWSNKNKQQVEVKARHALLSENYGDKKPVELNAADERILLDVDTFPLYLKTEEKPTVILLETPAISFAEGEGTIVKGGRVKLALTEETPAEFSGDHITVEKSDEGLFARLESTPGEDEIIISALVSNKEGVSYGRLFERLEVADPVTLQISPTYRHGEPVLAFTLTKFDSSAHLYGRVDARFDSQEFEEISFHYLMNNEEPSITNYVPIKKLPDIADVYHITAEVYQRIEELPEENTQHFKLNSVKEQISFMTSPRLEEMPKIDGDLTEWPDWPSIVLDSKEQLVGHLREWKGTEDSSAHIWTAWDEKYFYVAAEVVDNDISAPLEGHEVYKNDGLEVYFDTDLEGDLEQTRYSKDDNQYGLFTQGDEAIVYAWSHLNDYSPGGKIHINRAPRKEQTLSGREVAYIIEAAIPVDELDLEPSTGKHIGFSIALTDEDDPNTIHPFGQEVQLSWTAQRNAWQNPQTFADLFLVDQPAEE